MKILFRVDSSVDIGSGHVMRCLALAARLNSSADITFICRAETGHLGEMITARGFKLRMLPATVPFNEQQDASASLQGIDKHYDLLILDHYKLGAKYCRVMRSQCRYIMVIDDLANRLHDCDILLDQNLLPDAQSRYTNLVSSKCQFLLGPRFALLREEFYLPAPVRQDNRILISFGGSDAQNLTGMAIDALLQLKLFSIRADIVIGASNPWREKIALQLAQQTNIALHVQCDYMANLMHQASLMLGSGGTSHWERCICALPGLVVTVADNQVATTRYLAEQGACVWLGDAEEMSVNYLASQLEKYLTLPDQLEMMSRAANKIVPANAGTQYAVAEIERTIRGMNG